MTRTQRRQFIRDKVVPLVEKLIRDREEMAFPGTGARGEVMMGTDTVIIITLQDVI